MKLLTILLAPSLAIATGTTIPEDPPKGLAASDWSSIRAAYEAGRHAIHYQEDGTLTARNPGQQWRTEFDGKGFTVTPDHGQWTWGLELTGYGERTLLSAPSSITHEGGKITCQRDENLTEWFINDTRGLEQGWTIQSRGVGSLPAIAKCDGRGSPTSENLTLTLALRGDLKSQVSPDSSSVSFQTKSGTTALSYGGLKAWDADGTSLAVWFETADSESFRIALDDKNARYPITIDPIAQQAQLVASNWESSDGWGPCAIDGDTVAIGAFEEDSGATGINGSQGNTAAGQNSGAVYVFVRNGGSWSQQAYLKASNTGQNDRFGYSVALSGETLVVGSIGEDSNATGVNGDQSNNSSSGSGAAYVFVRNSGSWSQQAYLKASNPSNLDGFGRVVAISGDYLVVGSPNEGSNATGVGGNQSNESAATSGAAYVFLRNGVAWSQQAYLKASDTESGDEFGGAVAISGNTIVVGARKEDSGTTGVNGAQNDYGAQDSGAAYVFVRSGSAWSQQAYLKASNTGAGDSFGRSVAIDLDTLAIGADLEDSGSRGIDGSQLNDSAADSGAVYVFNRIGSNWMQQAFVKSSNSDPNDHFGTSVSVSGNYMLSGATWESSNATGVNGIQNDESASQSGAAYLFRRDGSAWSQNAYLKGSNGAGNNFGASSCLSNETLVVSDLWRDSFVFQIDEESSFPELLVEQAGSEVNAGGSRGFDTLAVGSNFHIAFSIRNTGTADLNLTGNPKVSVTGSGDFTIIAQPSSPVSGPNGSSTFTVRFAPTSVGTKNAVLSIPNNDSDENPFTINLSGTGVTAETAFNDAISANSTLTGPAALPSAIPFNDGVENLLKYAFNMNLSGPDSHSLVAGAGNSGLPAIGLTGSGPATMIRVEFLRRKVSGLIYTPKRSSTLAPGSFIPMGGTPVVSSINDNWERVVVQESANPATLPASFAIVEVSLP